MYIVTVDVEKCTACDECVDTCPNGAFEIVEEGGREHAEFTGDPDECTGCLSCEAVCPEGAITVTEM
jgi:2-oxoglutarate ferredoxin oxidoreductase subunit delta